VEYWNIGCGRRQADTFNGLNTAVHEYGDAAAALQGALSSTGSSADLGH
jgi:hypothetical protein